MTSALNVASADHLAEGNIPVTGVPGTGLSEAARRTAAALIAAPQPSFADYISVYEGENSRVMIPFNIKVQEFGMCAIQAASIALPWTFLLVAIADP